MDKACFQGTPVKTGSVARVITESGEPKTGAIILNGGGNVTVRCDITNANPDGFLFTATIDKTEVLLPVE